MFGFIYLFSVTLMFLFADGGIYQGWSPALSPVEKKAIEKINKQSRSQEKFILKAGHKFRGLVCVGDDKISSFSQNSILVESNDGCYLEQVGKQFLLLGKIEVQKISQSYINKFLDLIELAKKNNIKELKFIVGYDDEVKKAFKDLDKTITKYLMIEEVPAADHYVIKLIILEAQEINEMSVPAQSTITMFKSWETGVYEGALISAHGTIELNTIGCSEVGFSTSEAASVSCTLSTDKKIGDYFFPENTRLLVEKNSLKNGKKINILGATHSRKEIKLGDKIVPKNWGVEFSNSTYKLKPPPKD